MSVHNILCFHFPVWDRFCFFYRQLVERIIGSYTQTKREYCKKKFPKFQQYLDSNGGPFEFDSQAIHPQS